MYKKVRKFLDLRDKRLWDLGEFCLEDLVGESEEETEGCKRKCHYGEAWITEFMNQQGFVFEAGSLEIRSPLYHTDFWYEDPTSRPLDDDVSEWHQDAESDNRYLAIWASILPTKLRVVETKKEAVLLPKHLYIFDNMYYEHRMPMGKNQKRWFVRFYMFPSDSKNYSPPWHQLNEILYKSLC